MYDMKKIVKILLVLTLALTLAFTFIGCASSTANTPSSTPTTTPTGTTITKEAGQQLALDFLKNSSTFKFDGLDGSIKVINGDYSPISAYRSFAYTIEYQTRHPGHGDRTGQYLAQVITNHNAVIIVNAEKGQVIIAVCDNTWDIVNQKVLPTSVSGFVVSGGDTTPADGPLDAPRKFVFKIQKNDGTLVNVAYTAYPPSPAGTAAMAKIKLAFYGTPVKEGDYLEASGIYDQDSNTVTVAEQGDYIRTYQKSITVLGAVITGGDTTPADGPLDAPRKFVYKLRKDDGTFVDVAYTAYPPSPAGNAAMAKISLSLYDGSIKAGDYMKAQGTYDKETNTVTVVNQGDFIKTYPQKPLD